MTFIALLIEPRRSRAGGAVMPSRRRILITSMLILAGGMFCTVAITVAILYRLELKEQRDHLMEIARGQAHVMEAVARFNEIHMSDDDPGVAWAATLSQIAAAHERYSGSGATCELVIAQREGEQIAFLFPRRNGNGDDPDPVPWESELAEPMRRALSGQEGTINALDYRGKRVLAAFHPVGTWNLGVVAKADLAEVRAPFVAASVVAGGVTVLLVLVGVGLTLRVTDPLVRSLQESEERFRLTLDAVSGGGWDWDMATGEVRYSDRWLESLGYKRDDVVPHVSFWESIVHPDDIARTKEVLNSHLDGRTPSYECENRIRAASGEYRWNLDCGKVVARDSRGKPLRMVGTDLDIGERKRAAEALRQERDFAEGLIETAPAIVLVLDTEGRIVRFNSYMERLSGYRLEEVRGKDWFTTFLPESDHDRIRDVFSRAARGSHTTGNVNPIVTKDGRHREIEWHNTDLQDADGHITGVLAVGQDVTERKTAEQQQELARQVMDLLNQADERTDAIRDILSLIQEFTGVDAVAVRLQDGEDFPYSETRGFSDNFVESERYLCSRDERGAPVRDAQGKPCLECMCGAVLRGRTDPSLPFFTEGGSFRSNSMSDLLSSVTKENLRPRGGCNREGYESVALIPLYSGKAVIGLLQLNDRRRDRFPPDLISFFEGIGASIGITLARIQAEERARARQAELAHVARLSVMGEMASGLAHELNQPLCAILSAAQGGLRMLGNEATGAEPVEEALLLVERQARRAGDIIRHMRDFVRGRKPRRLPVDLNEIVRETVNLLQHLAKQHGIALRLASHNPLSPVLADAIEIQQVLFNLVRNGLESMAETHGGTLTIETSMIGDDAAELAVRDEGCGLPEGDAERIYDSFFTTKFAGMGMGLSICRTIVAAHGGRLWSEPNDGDGTTFRLQLPLAEREVEHAAADRICCG